MDVRALGPGDLPELLRLQQDAYAPELQEPPEVFLDKLERYPTGAWGAERSGELAGYLFVVPWSGAEVLPLGHCLPSLPDRPDTVYIHDLAVARAARGQGVAQRLLGCALALGEALGVERYALVAVQGSEPFWERQGFRVVRAFEYAPGVPASHMSRPRHRR